MRPNSAVIAFVVALGCKAGSACGTAPRGQELPPALRTITAECKRLDAKGNALYTGGLGAALVELSWPRLRQLTRLERVFFCARQTKSGAEMTSQLVAIDDQQAVVRELGPDQLLAVLRKPPWELSDQELVDLARIVLEVEWRGISWSVCSAAEDNYPHVGCTIARDPSACGAVRRDGDDTASSAGYAGCYIVGADVISVETPSLKPELQMQLAAVGRIARGPGSVNFSLLCSDWDSDGDLTIEEFHFVEPGTLRRATSKLGIRIGVPNAGALQGSGRTPRDTRTRP